MSGRKRKDVQDEEVAGTSRKGKRSKPKEPTARTPAVAATNQNQTKQSNEKPRKIIPGHQLFNPIEVPQNLNVAEFGKLFDGLDFSSSNVLVPKGIDYFLALAKVVLNAEIKEFETLFIETHKKGSPTHQFALKVKQNLKLQYSNSKFWCTNSVRTLEKLLSTHESFSTDYQKFWQYFAAAGLTSFFVIKAFALRPEKQFGFENKSAGEMFELLREKDPCLYSCFANYEIVKNNEHCNKFDWTALENLRLDLGDHKEELEALLFLPNLKYCKKSCAGNKILDLQPSYLKALQDDVLTDTVGIGKLEMDRSFHLKLLKRIEDQLSQANANKLVKVEALQHLKESSTLIVETKGIYNDLLAASDTSAEDYPFSTFTESVVNLLMTDHAQKFLTSEMKSVKDQASELAVSQAMEDAKLQRRLTMANAQSNSDPVNLHQEQVETNNSSNLIDASLHDVLSAALATAGVDGTNRVIMQSEDGTFYEVLQGNSTAEVALPSAEISSGDDHHQNPEEVTSHSVEHDIFDMPELL